MSGAAMAMSPDPSKAFKVSVLTLFVLLRCWLYWGSSALLWCLWVRSDGFTANCSVCKVKYLGRSHADNMVVPSEAMQQIRLSRDNCPLHKRWTTV